MSLYNPLDPFGLNWPKGGGGGRAFRPPPPPEPEPEPEPEAAQPPAAEAKPEAHLSEPSWIESESYFQSEADVKVRLTLPAGAGHLTRVEGELWAKWPEEKSPIFKGEAWADAEGYATMTMPIFKPRGYQSGNVDYYTIFKHKMAKDLDTRDEPRTVEKTKLKAADHMLIPGPAFPEGTSFISPRATEALKKVAEKFKKWEKKTPKKTAIVVYGHADKTEKDPKALSERRAQSAYAFITNDSDTWEKLYQTEKWGLGPLQELLKDLGHYNGKIDGQDTPATQAAFKAFQKKSKLPEGKEDAATRKALFKAYMQGKHDVKLEADRFRQVAGHPWMGCAAYNRVNESEGPTPENRRVAFVLVRESKHFPISFPCQENSDVPCGGQCKRKGERSAPGIGCMFYDELIREETQEFCEAEPQKEAEPISYKEVQEIAFKVTGNYETEKCDYKAVTGNFDGAGVSFGAMQWNTKWGTLQELLKGFEAEDKTLFEKCFDNDAKILKRIREVMGEKQQNHNPPFPDGMKWATEEVHEWKDKKANWKGNWKSYLTKLGTESKFQAVQIREGIARNKDATEAKIGWLKEQNPSAWSTVSLRCYCALFDFTNQYNRTKKELDEVEKAWKSKMPATALEMTQDFIRIVVETRQIGQNSDDKETYLERRQGILYAGVCDGDVTSGYAKPNRKKTVEDLVGRDKFIQDYPGA